VARTIRATRARTAAYDVQRFFAGASQPLAARYAGWFGFFDDSALAPDFARAVAGHSAVESLERAFAAASGLNPVDTVLSVDVATYLPDDLLVKTDVASMAHGLEARAPLLDQELMQFAATLPPSLKLRGWRGKQLLRRVARDRVPREILEAPKRGFGVPLDRWFRTDLADLVHDRLAGPAAPIADYVARPVIDRTIHEHLTGVRSHSQRLWALLMLDAWIRECVQLDVPAVRTLVTQ
jgi:asparagine synthase (glutamine-hydrolysing)